MICCVRCKQEAVHAGADGKVCACDRCKHHWCDPCANELWGKGRGMLSCQLCNSELCVGCNDWASGGDYGIITACSQCDFQACDLCTKKGKGKGVLQCVHCGTQLCLYCERKCPIWGCDRCDRQVCDRCICEGKDQILGCEHCDAVGLCQSCNDKGKGEGMLAIFSCSYCDRQVCNLCTKKGKGKGVLQCVHCGTQLCLYCERKCPIWGCDRCDRQVCDRCICEGKDQILGCEHCDAVGLCQSCNDKGKGQGMRTILSCSRCDQQICDQCVGNTRGTTEYRPIGIALLCQSCKDWDFFADYKESRSQFNACKAEKGTLQREVDEVRSQLTDSLAGLEASRAQLDASEAEKRTLQMKVDDLRCQLAEKGTLQRKVDELTAQLAAAEHQSKLEPFSQVMPSCDELADFLRDTLPNLRPEMQAKVPIQALRWTHNGINAQLAFGDDHEHAEESIFKLFEQLFRERLTPLELTEEDPLPVFLHRGPDQHLGLYSRRNRRLTTLLMYQALRREELVKVHVLVCSPQDPKWRKDWQKAYDGSTGLSIRPHEGRRARARHCGVPLFEGNMHMFKDTLARARARPHSQKVQEALDLLASRMKQRPSSRARDEESVTFANTEGGEEVLSSPPTRQQGRTGKGRGRGKGKGK